jgi:hypothetical protein
MPNHNVEMLENLVSVAVNTRYKEVPPSEAEFIEQAQLVRSGMAAFCPVTEPEFQTVIKRLEESLVIKMDVGTYIDDRKGGYQSWLPARRADTEFFFWNRYKKYLEEQKHWNPRVTATLDKVSDEIVDLLGDPKSDSAFQRRGLVLGDVQSGKTANYTAVCNKAADTGYRIIVIMAGLLENLRRQTQERMDKEFSGRKSNYYLDPKAKQEIKNTPVGVGRFGATHRIASFTSVTKDFDKAVLRSNNLALANVRDPVVLIVKKNKNILNNLTSWLMSNNADFTSGKIALPLLLIDDEADNASVNTRKGIDDPAAINVAIRKLLKCFDRASYVGITATPFANVFINPDTEDEMLGDDLFPGDFIYSLSPPSNYIGADQMFVENSPYANALVSLSAEEMDGFFPFSHKKDMRVDALPPSMFEAMGYFLLVNAIRDWRGDATEHRSMMIHVSRFTDVQLGIVEQANEWLVQIKSDLQSYTQLPMEEALKISNIRFLYDIWLKYDLCGISMMTWEELQHGYLYRAVAPIDVRAVNQSTGTTSLDYFRHEDDGLRVIAVGGNSLSRGLTLYGLCVSYFYRKSSMYDTLLQMARWFGYRPNYEDLVKVWIAQEAIDWYGYITQAADELKLEIAKMKAANQTPRDFGLRVRQDPNSLIATARNKMRSATPMKRPITVSGRLLETPRLKADKQVLASNERVFKDFVGRLDHLGCRREGSQFSKFYWSNVPKEAVSELLLSFETHPWHLAFQGRALAEYIDEKMDDGGWDVVIAEGGGSQYGQLQCGDKSLEIQTELRDVLADDKMIRISGTSVRVGAGGFTRVGLTKDQIRLAEASAKKGKSVPDNAYLVCGRSPILILHVIEVKPKKGSEDAPPVYLFALGVGFPDTGAEVRTANYMVNMTDLKNWMDPTEDEDE